jgi:hypothetical protein
VIVEPAGTEGAVNDNATPEFTGTALVSVGADCAAPAVVAGPAATTNAAMRSAEATSAAYFEPPVRAVDRQ